MPTFLLIDAEAEGWPVVACSEHVLHLTGFGPGAVLGRRWPPLWDEAEHGRQVEELRASIAARRRARVDLPTVRNGRPALPTTVTVEPVLGEAGPLVALSVLERGRDERWLAFHDQLTGLPNRSMLDRDLDVAIDRAARSGTAVAVLYLDLDGFKPVNDELGHDAGDAVLRAVADRLRACTRAHDLVVRLGGDEFVVVLTDLARPGVPQAEAVAANLRRAIAAPVRIGAVETAVGASVGIGVFPEDGADGAGLVAWADAAMYRDKGGRGNGAGRPQAVDPAAVRRALLRRAALAKQRAGALHAATARNLRVADARRAECRTERRGDA